MVYYSELLENFLWFLHGMTDAYDNMIVQFEMGSRLLLWWTPNVDLFLRERDMYQFLNDPALVAEDYYKQVITDYFSKIHSEALKRTTNANTEDKEPFKLQVTIWLEPWGFDISSLHMAVQLKPVWTPVAIFGSLGVCIYGPASRHWLISYSPIHLT